MRQKIQIRSAQIEDATAILEVLNPIIADGRLTIMEEEFSLEEQVEYIQRFRSGRRGIYNVALPEGDRRIVGIQGVEPVSVEEKALRHVGEISTFVVMDLLGEGIGKEMSSLIFRQAREEGFLKLIAMIRADNLRALSFYQSLGFDIVGRAKRHAQVRGTFIDEIFTELIL
ncbi:MAG: GNAT family N-acetyltransferase [Ignavibacteriae bacterium]|nr:GNAT family N-acetyltransferase [Ignavibacteriota bacterium]MCB9215890.1 GNAT family N-acetyltransferase [Ignavibacteria bacterium]